MKTVKLYDWKVVVLWQNFVFVFVIYVIEYFVSMHYTT